MEIFGIFTGSHFIMKVFIFFILLLPAISLADSSGIKIGLSLPLSGALQEYGDAVRNAFAMAQEEVENSEYELFYEDNQFDGKTSVTSFKVLTEIKKADLIYLWGEPCLYSVAPLSNAKKIPILTMSVDRKPAKNNPYVIRTINPSADFIGTVFSNLRNSSSGTYNKIGIIMSEDTFFEGLLEELISQANEKEVVKVIARVSPDKMDFKTELLKVKVSDIDILAVYLFPGQVSTAYRTMKNMGLSIPTFGTDIFESANEVLQSQTSMIGAKYPNLDIPDDFKNRYIGKFGNDLQISYAYNAYTTARFLLSVTPDLQKTKQIKTNLKDELIRLLSLESENPFSLKNDGEYGYYFSYPLALKEIKKDGFEKVQ
jgi:ABC-type branched-subunit amino acid transport system substrate-binding protein